MINRTSISNFIGDIHGILLSIGHKLKTEGKILKVHFVEPDMVCVALIQDDEKQVYTSLSYNDQERKIVAECDCHSATKCEHAAALALYLLSDMKNVEFAGSTLGFISGFTNNRCNEWREVEKPDNMAWQDFLTKLKPRNSRFSSFHFFDGFLDAENLLNLQTANTGYYVDRVEYTAQFKVEGGTLHAICHECNENTKKFCTHQSTILDLLNSNVSLNAWFQSKISYQQLRYQYLDKFNFNSQEFDQEFQIHFDQRHFFFKPKTGTLFQAKTKQYISEIYQEQQTEIDKENLETKRNEATFGQAFLWFNQSNFNQSPGYNFIEAKLNKSRSKLINNFRPIAFPDKLGADIQELHKNIQENYHRLYDQNSLYLKQLLENLKLNRLTLSDFTHFYFTGEYNPALQTSYLLEHSLSSDENLHKLSKKDLLTIEFSPSLCHYKIKTKKYEGFVLLWVDLEIDKKVIQTPASLHNPIFTVIGQKAYLHDEVLTEKHQKLLRLLQKVYYPMSQLDEFLDTMLEAEHFFDVEWDADLQIKREELTGGVMELYIDEHGENISFEAKLNYGELSFNILTDKSKKIGSTIYTASKNELREFQKTLASFHPVFTSESTNYNAFTLNYTELLQGLWFLDFFENCKQENIEVYGENNLTQLKFSSHIPNISTHIKAQKNWFDVELDIKFDQIPVKLKDWVEAMRNKSRYVRLSDGTLGILPENWFDKLQQIYEMSDTVDGKLQVNPFKFNAIEEVFEDEEIEGGDLMVRLQEKKQRLLNFKQENTYQIPSIIKADLRPYQWVGYQWLKFLDDFQMGGILADEMGLGKTLQLICLLADFKMRQVNRPSLIIVPRSLLFNWTDEIEKFCPSLETHVHHGTNRKVDVDFFLDQDVIITTYDTAVQDRDLLADIQFHYIVLDESQAIKNPITKRFQAVSTLNSKNRLAMTGTPIENNTFDLYAQFSFVNPGIFGSPQQFKKKYSIPIDVDESSQVAARLQKLVAPYLLRRTKKQVAKDLPPKSESIIYCELRPFQRDMYDSLKNKIRNDIIEAMENPEKKNKASFLAIEGLLRLRQICNSPYLVDKTLPENKRESSKLNILTDILAHELGDSSALVFSQFTSMLALIKEKLDEKGIKYAYLDGSTRNRREVVEKFQTDPEIKIFLISLKAGNTGLNLTKAEYVYIVDPWWNPAVEAQAIDRTHRIGQDKHIIAYRMISENTIEEKIVELQQKKKKVAADLIHSEEEMFRSLKKEELLGLFEI